MNDTDFAERLDRLRRDIEAYPGTLTFEWLTPKPGYAARAAIVCRCCHTEEILNLGWPDREKATR